MMGTIKYVKSVLYEMKKELLSQVQTQTLQEPPKVSRTLHLDQITANAVLRFLDSRCILFQKDNLYHLELNMQQVNNLILNLAH